ncbi:MAG: signal peptidase I [Anaerovoracaceae bacterium]
MSEEENRNNAEGEDIKHDQEAQPEAPAPEGEQPEKKEKSSAKSGFVELLRDIAIAVCIAFLVTLVIKPTIVKEESMEPNFYNNDYLFVYKLAYHSKTPERGDVIIFKSSLKTETGKDKLLIKRVIAVPGDTISISDGNVYINGKKDKSSYTKDGYTNGVLQPTKIPKGKLFCMGDNRLVSRDSRDSSVGLVSEDKVVGKVVFRLFPFKRAGRITNPYK